jgi:hypothetical protein
MADRRGEQSAAESATALPRQIRAGLSPVQVAYAAFTDHFMGCSHCRDVDRGYCTEGERMWQGYQAEDARARERMAKDVP